MVRLPGSSCWLAALTSCPSSGLPSMDWSVVAFLLSSSSSVECGLVDAR